MTVAVSHLSKSKYMAGLHCPRRLWLMQRRPDRAAPISAGDRTIRAIGETVGRRAHHLFPGGVAAGDGSEPFPAAVARTNQLLHDDSVDAIFEGAFEFEGVRIRADVLERVGAKAWGLREVKAAARPKESYLDDIAVQMYVLLGCGLEVPSVELLHVDTDFVREDAAIDWTEFFSRVDVTDAVAARRSSTASEVARLLAVSEAPEPDVEPGLHCRGRRLCDFWGHCTREKDRDWILHLPRLTRKQLAALRELGVERIPDVPADFGLQPAQQNAWRAHRDVDGRVAGSLEALAEAPAPPAAYLDFETVSPAVPLYPGTRPFQVLPFQWSLHSEGADGALAHASFLARGDVDPRRDFAESLLGELANGDEPIFVYSAFESRVLDNLGSAFPELRDPLAGVRHRLVDLLPIVRNGVYHVEFAGSFSIKNVAPALSPGFGYDDLGGIAEGGPAAAAFEQIVTLGVESDEARELREQLLAYCSRDTLALVEIHRALRSIAESGSTSWTP